MPRLAAANALIRRIFHRPTGITGNDGSYTAELVEYGFRAPETTAAKYRNLGFRIAHGILPPEIPITLKPPQPVRKNASKGKAGRRRRKTIKSTTCKLHCAALLSSL